MSLPHLLLGMLRTPATGYDLKQTFDRTLRHFWTAELSQIYPTLQQLERDGYLRSARAPSARGPARRLYRRTAAGRRHLLAWLGEAPHVGDQRLAWLGQLCFMAETRSTRRAARFLGELRDHFATLLERYRTIEAQWFRPLRGFPDALPLDDLHAHFTLRAGVARTKAAVAWCDECLARIRRRAA